jgi:hypothetical protein
MGGEGKERKKGKEKDRFGMQSEIRSEKDGFYRRNSEIQLN